MYRKRIPDDIRMKVRKYFARTGKSQAQVAKHFGLSQSVVCCIINNYNPPYKANVVMAYPKQPAICSHFGCGRSLSIREQLFGNRCIHHSNPPDTNTR